MMQSSCLLTAHSHSGLSSTETVNLIKLTIELQLETPLDSKRLLEFVVVGIVSFITGIMAV